MSVFVNMTNIVVKDYTVLYICVDIMICQSERSPKGLQITSGGRRNVEETFPAFTMSFAKPFLLKTGYSEPSKIVVYWTFHMSVFVNTTNMVVNSDTVLYMCMKVIICQSDMSPKRLMISQTSSIGGTSNHLRWEKECGGNFPSFWD